MNTRISTIGLGVFALTALVMTAPTAFAETVNLKASLKAADSVPPNTSNGSGSLQATYDTANKQLTYTVTYSGLTGNATAAHFHGPADPGKTAGVVVPVQGSVASPTSWPGNGTSTSIPRRTNPARFAARLRSDGTARSPDERGGIRDAAAHQCSKIKQVVVP